MSTFASLSKQSWPSESDPRGLDHFYGDPRGAGGRAAPAWMQENLTTIVPPWSMRTDGKAVSEITIHKKCRDSLTRILNAIWDSTGHDAAKIKAANLDQFDGTYNFRMNVNSPSKLSLHAYGAAIDLAAAENPNGVPWRENGRMLPRWAIDAFLAEGWSWGGDFSGTPDAMHFQATFNRHADAPQDQPTSISSASAPLTGDKKFSVTATVFGGPNDDQAVAYSDVGSGWADRPGVALPFRFWGQRPDVIVSANGKTVACRIVDVGPWNTSDPYWMTGERPQAESGTDMSGRPTNHAGIDLTPAAAEAVGLDGKGRVVWFFDPKGVTHMPVDTPTPSNGLTLAELADALARIERLIGAQNLPGMQAKLGQVNGALGQTLGKLLDGRKSAIGIIGALVTGVLQDPAISNGLPEGLSFLGSSGFLEAALPIFLALGTWGVLGKLEKWFGASPIPAKTPSTA